MGNFTIRKAQSKEACQRKKRRGNENHREDNMEETKKGGELK